MTAITSDDNGELLMRYAIPRFQLYDEEGSMATSRFVMYDRMEGWLRGRQRQPETITVSLHASDYDPAVANPDVPVTVNGEALPSQAVVDERALVARWEAYEAAHRRAQTERAAYAINAAEHATALGVPVGTPAYVAMMKQATRLAEAAVPMPERPAGRDPRTVVFTSDGVGMGWNGAFQRAYDTGGTVVIEGVAEHPRRDMPFLDFINLNRCHHGHQWGPPAPLGVGDYLTQDCVRCNAVRQISARVYNQEVDIR